MPYSIFGGKAKARACLSSGRIPFSGEGQGTKTSDLRYTTETQSIDEFQITYFSKSVPATIEDLPQSHHFS